MIKNIPDPQRIHSIACPKCASTFIATHLLREPKFCLVCGLPLKPEEETKKSLSDSESNGVITLVEGHEPEEANIKFTLGQYKVMSSIGRGGMGEVFLAYDTTCGRRIALKKVRSDFSEHSAVEERFLKEARITAQLTHPAIIPIYEIHAEAKNNFYTMPFVEGETLKQLIRRARAAEKKGSKIADIAFSIPALVRQFITICHAIAYSHSKKILHRDLKPENILIGKFGEVLILDWGLAKVWDPNSNEKLPKGAKVVGTLSYMPPERVFGTDASPLSDIYALGVILYQILTLRMPFIRGTLKEFKKNIGQEVLRDPSEMAPWREVPRILSGIVMKCLDPDPTKRYHTVTDLISDLDSYIEGRAEFFPTAQLNINNQADWEFQENVLIAEHMAITRNAEYSDWVNLMISKASFSENLRMEARFTLAPNSLGIGFLLAVPEATERAHLIEGYCLWLGTNKDDKSRLLKSAVEVLPAPELILETGKEIFLKIEKVDKSLRVWVNGALELSYVSHIPISGTHVGLLLRDFEFELSELVIYEGSQNILVNCLAIPDAFLANKDYQKALSEYRRIAYSFPGRSEGREAAFRVGVVLLEQGLEMTDIQAAHALFDEALEEFEKLHNTPGAPLEYLGKALVYHALLDYQEEIKCFELAFRRYPNHPLLHVLDEQILFRLHESAKTDRNAAYSFILLILQYLPQHLENHSVKRILDSINKHAEPLWFIEKPDNYQYDRRYWGIILAFWLNKAWVIEEILKNLQPEDTILLKNGIWALKELNETEMVANYENQVALDPDKELYYKLVQHLENKEIDPILESLKDNVLYPIPLACLKIQALMLKGEVKQAGEELLRFPLEWHTKESTLLPYLYGCWLYITEGKDLSWIHFSGTLETMYPRSWTLGSLFLIEKLPPLWKKRAFWYEERELARQQAFFSALS